MPLYYTLLQVRVGGAVRYHILLYSTYYIILYYATLLYIHIAPLYYTLPQLRVGGAVRAIQLFHLLRAGLGDDGEVLPALLCQRLPDGTRSGPFPPPTNTSVHNSLRTSIHNEPLPPNLHSHLPSHPRTYLHTHAFARSFIHSHLHTHSLPQPPAHSLAGPTRLRPRASGDGRHVGARHEVGEVVRPGAGRAVDRMDVCDLSYVCMAPFLHSRSPHRPCCSYRAQVTRWIVRLLQGLFRVSVGPVCMRSYRYSSHCSLNYNVQREQFEQCEQCEQCIQYTDVYKYSSHYSPNHSHIAPQVMLRVKFFGFHQLLLRSSFLFTHLVAPLHTALQTTRISLRK